MTTNAVLSERIRQRVACNLQLSVHPSFLEKHLPGALYHFAALKHPRLRFKTTAYLLRTFKTEPISEELSNHPYYGFLTLSHHQWNAFAARLGALYFSEEIKTTIRHFRKRILLSLISEKGYDFVIRRGNLYAPMLKSIAVPPHSGEPEQKIHAVGRFLLEYLWTQQPKPLLQRLVLNFSDNITWNFQHVIDPHLQQQLFNVCKHLLKETEDIELCSF